MGAGREGSETPVRLSRLCAVGVVAAGLLAVPPGPAAASLTSRTAEIALTGSTADAPLGGGVALVMGPSMIPTPSQQYLDAVDELYLQPNGFTGTTVALTTPASTMGLAESEAEGAAILTAAIQNQLATGEVDAANPVVVFGYSQSAAFVTMTMEQLHDQGVPSDLVHFVLVGNPANPNGGMLTAYDIPPGSNAFIPLMNVVLGNPTPDHLYPTDIYTIEYDGYGDFPNFPMSGPAFLNATFGLLTQHSMYLGLDPERIANAVELPTSGDGLVNYYMIPSPDILPVLEPWRLIPVFGPALYELFEPVTRILVNLGYGSITEGWNQGPADVETPLSFAPPFNWFEAGEAMVKAMQDGVAGFLAELADPATYGPAVLEDNPLVVALTAGAYGVGIVDSPHAPVSELLGAITALTAAALDPAALAAG